MSKTSVEARLASLRAWYARSLGVSPEVLARVRTPRLALAPFQHSAWLAVETLLHHCGGALLADEVGLGKSYVALAALAARTRALVCAPAMLLGMWRGLLEAQGLGDVVLCSHAGLHKLSLESWDLVVVDEAQAFVRHCTQRGRALARVAAHSPLLMLSATPVGMSSLDVAKLLRFYSHGQDMVPVLGEALDRWLAHPEHLLLLRWLVVRRSRAMVQRQWPQGVTLPGVARRLFFPTRQMQSHEWNLEAEVPQVWRALGALTRWNDPALGLSGGLWRTLLLSRIESSFAALSGTLARLEGFLVRAEEAGREGRVLDRRAWHRIFGGLAFDQDVQQVFSFMLSPLMNAPLQTTAFQQAVALVRPLRALLRETVDPKHLLLQRILREREGDRVMIVTRSAESARAIWAFVGRHFPHQGVACVVGQGAWVGDARRPWKVTPQEVFMRLQGKGPAALNLQILVATDVLSEGVNLTSCQTIISFDLPWNPRRLVQRHGRADRLGVGRRALALKVLVPTGALEGELRLASRVQARAAQAEAILGDCGGLGQTLAGASEQALPEPSREERLLWTMRHCLLRGPAPDTASLGWVLPVCVKAPPGCLVALAHEDPWGPLRWVWCAPGRAPRWMEEFEAWSQVQSLTRRQALPASALPESVVTQVFDLGSGWSKALRRARRKPWRPLPGSAQAMALSRLAGVAAPQAHELDACQRRSQVWRRLRAPCTLAQSQALELLAQQDKAWLCALEDEVLSWPAPSAFVAPVLQLVGFVVWVSGEEFERLGSLVEGGHGIDASALAPCGEQFNPGVACSELVGVSQGLGQHSGEAIPGIYDLAEQLRVQRVVLDHVEQDLQTFGAGDRGQGKAAQIRDGGAVELEGLEVGFLKPWSVEAEDF